MPVHPELLPVLEEIRKARTQPVQTMPIKDVRKIMAHLLQRIKPVERVAKVEEVRVPVVDHSLLIRIYAPEAAGDFPVLLFFHGGGWAMGDLETCEARCRTIANHAGCIVLSVHYRLAPEHPFPAAVEDGFAALKWAYAHAGEWGGDTSRIAVGGESSGGNVAAAVAQMTRDKKGPKLSFQWLLYPVLDTDFDTSSYKRNGKGYFLERDAMVYFWDLYAPNQQDKNNPYACPLKAKEFKRLAPAFIATAELDPLLDEGDSYAKKLKSAGVPVQYKCYSGMVHGFLNWEERVDIAHQHFLEMISILKESI